jgi:prolyl-tRNA synthetase
MLGVYADFAESWMAIPVLRGVKSPSERFAGALETYAIEALMQDGKALQAGTSHFLGQNFAKAFDVKYLNKENQLDYVWATSWGVSTRLMGALIMAHSDDNGLVLPPKLAPIQVAIVPVFKNAEQLGAISETVAGIKKSLEKRGISVKYDDRDTHKPGWKFSEYEFKGVPVRITIGPRDIEQGTVEVARRDTLEKEILQITDIDVKIEHLLDSIQKNLYDRAQAFKENNSFRVDSWDEFKRVLDETGGFIYAHWDGTAETEEKIKEETKATIRVIPLNNPPEPGKCVYSGKPSSQRVVFARAY